MFTGIWDHVETLSLRRDETSQCHARALRYVFLSHGFHSFPPEKYSARASANKRREDNISLPPRDPRRPSGRSSWRPPVTTSVVVVTNTFVSLILYFYFTKLLLFFFYIDFSKLYCRSHACYVFKTDDIFFYRPISHTSFYCINNNYFITDFPIKYNFNLNELNWMYIFFKWSYNDNYT